MVYYTTTDAVFSSANLPLARVHFAMMAGCSLGKVLEAAKEVCARDVFVIASQYQGLVARPALKDKQAHVLILNEKALDGLQQPVVLTPQSNESLGVLSRGGTLSQKGMKPALEQEIKLLVGGVPTSERLATMAKVYNPTLVLAS